MSDGAAIIISILLAVIYLATMGTRNQLKRIAGFCERNEPQASGEQKS